jgi:hypothetical protein
MLLLVKLALLLAGFLLALRRGLDLGLLLLLATIAVEALFPIAPRAFLAAVGDGVASRETLNLVGVIFITIALGRVMAEAGTLRLMTRSLADLIPDYRLVLALPPALVGLLPMPAGALVSAPLVNDAAGDKPISPEARTFINYWFRHLWEYIWPLYPGLIIGAAVLDIPVRRFALAQYPLTAAAIAVGLAWLARHVPRDRAEEARARDRRAGARGVAASTWPFAAILVGVFGARAPVLAALAATTALVVLAALLPPARIAPRRIAALFAQSASPRTLLLLLAVMAFKEALEACGALTEIPRVLDAAGVPALVPLFIAPFLVGLLTGVNQAYVAITFPMLAPLMSGAAGSGGPVGEAAPLDMSLVMFAYVSGFLGILLSPTHLCLVLTREYFKADFPSVYRLLAAPVIALFLTAVGLLLIRSL